MPQYIEVEYDPFAPVPVEHNPWEGQPDPFAYQPPVQQVADRRVEDRRVENQFNPPPDNRDMQVQAPGQNQFPNQMFGTLLHPNAAGIYGSGERPAPEGDVVLPSAGYRDASSRNAYILRPDENPVIRNYDESMVTGFRKISDERALDLGYTPSINPDDYLQRYPLVGDVPPTTPSQAWFENTPVDLYGDYSRGKPIDVIRRGNLRGTYRYATPF